MAELSDKQKRFVEEYLIDCNATQAAIRAGYSQKRASELGYQLLQKTTVQQTIQKAMDERAKRTEITADYVLQGLKTVADRCMKGEPIIDREGNETGEWRFDSGGANRALELLGKHLKLFTDKVEHSGTVTFEQMLEQMDD